MDEPRADKRDATEVSIASLDVKIGATYDHLSDRLEALDRFVNTRIGSAETALRAAEATTKTALDTAKTSSETALIAAKEALDARLHAGDEQLLIHIDAQKESVVTALTALERLSAERDKATELADHRQREALNKADSTLSIRLEQMNEFRKQISEERTSYLTKDSHAIETRALLAAVERNRLDVSEKVSRESHDESLAAANTWRLTVEKRLNEAAGRGEGITTSAKIVSGVIAAVGTILAIIVLASNGVLQHDTVPQSPPPVVTVTSPKSTP